MQNLLTRLLKVLKKKILSKVFIHDAARPNFSLKFNFSLFKNLKKYKCVVPAIKTNDSVKLKNKNQIINLKRENIYLTQTPQAFDYNELYKLQKIKVQKLLMMQIYLLKLVKKLK